MRWSNGLLALAMTISVLMINCGGSGAFYSGGTPDGGNSTTTSGGTNGDTSTSGGSTTTSGGTTTTGGASGDTSTSGGTTTSGGSTTTVSFTMQLQPIFNTRCVGGLCHSNRPPVLAPEQSYDNLVNIASTNTPGMIRVIPFDPDNSVLYLRVEGRSLGTQMPKSGGVLSDEEIALFRTWIAEGALYN